MPISPEVQSRLDFARQIALDAGETTLRHFQTGVEVIRKQDNSPVTIADREAEEVLRDAIQEAYPEDGILGEEYGAKESRSGYRWILDPIDGTKSFITGVPLYGTLVACEVGGESLIGVIAIPALGEMVYAAKGAGAWYQKSNEAPVAARVSDCTKLSDATFVTSEVKTFLERGAGEAYESLEHTAYITRTWGDCYGYLLVATGRAEVMIDPILNLWDAAAIQPILEEAGGSFTDWKGARNIFASEAVGTNTHVLKEVLKHLAHVD